jgi:hypothetical protein
MMLSFNLKSAFIFRADITARTKFSIQYNKLNNIIAFRVARTSPIVIDEVHNPSNSAILYRQNPLD